MYEFIDETIGLRIPIKSLKPCGVNARILGNPLPVNAKYYEDMDITCVYDLKNYKRYYVKNNPYTFSITNFKLKEIGTDIIVISLDEQRKEETMSNSNRLQSILELADKRRDEIVPLFLGAPGIGKTQAVYEFAEKHNRKVVEIIASQILPSEVSGITMPDEKTGSMRVFDHARLSSLKDGDILFFDELWQADTHVLSACLTLIQERRMMSGKKLPDVLIVAAANPSVTPQMIPASIRQRFITINIEFDKSEFKNYIKRKYGLDLGLDILNHIVSDSNTWNFVTPRVVEKLIRLAFKCESEDDQRAFINFVSSAYDYEIATNILDLVTNNKLKLKSKNEIKKIAAAFNHNLDDSMEISDMIQYLMSLPEWNEIKREMEGVEL